MENAPLKTQKIRDAEAAAKRQKYPKTLIRFRIPNGTVLEAHFLSEEPGKKYL